MLLNLSPKMQHYLSLTAYGPSKADMAAHTLAGHTYRHVISRTGCFGGAWIQAAI